MLKIYFKSSPDSCHAQLFEAEKAVAGTILPDKLNTLLPQGVQFQGTLLEKKHSIFAKASKQYYKHHPLALAKSGEIWIIRLDKIKMTDNSKGFGTKIHWQRHT